jgi:hypothetical protein
MGSIICNVNVAAPVNGDASRRSYAAATPFAPHGAKKVAAWRKLLDSAVAGISYEDVSGTVTRNASWVFRLTFSVPIAAFKSCDS